MNKLVLTITLLIVLLAALTAAYRAVNGGTPGEFDFYLFVQQWEYSYCSQQTCVAGKVREAFTIHGMWPENNDGSYPSFCSGPAFSSNAIQDLVNELNYIWPSLTGPNTDFWTHEWSKHGTCAIGAGPIGDQHDFFSAAIKIYNTYNITSGLSSHSITPSNSQSYSIDSILSALSSAIGYTPLLQCQNGQLSTVTLCVTKDLNLMDCPTLSGWSCSGSTTIPSSD